MHRRSVVKNGISVRRGACLYDGDDSDGVVVVELDRGLIGSARVWDTRGGCAANGCLVDANESCRWDRDGELVGLWDGGFVCRAGVVGI